MDRANVDTDQIIPKQFLKRIERTGFGQFLFNDWRFLEDGTLNPQFELNRPRKQREPQFFLPGVILGVVRVESMLLGLWLITDFDVIAPTFADIFYSNCFSNGILAHSAFGRRC